MKLTNFLLIVIAFLACNKSNSQSQSVAKGNIAGIVIDTKTQEPLMAVSVGLLGTNYGTTTDINGKFNLSNIPVGSYNLVITTIGFDIIKLQNIEVKNGETKNVGQINLFQNSISLKEVVVSPGSFSVMGVNEMARLTLSAQDLKNMSWAEDLTRAVARLPGVSSNDFSSKFTVRGGEADEVLMTIDGMELYEPFHQRDFVGGLFSIVDIETIQSVDLLTGGFSSEFGQRQSGVFQMKTKTIPFDTKHTSIGLNVMNARIYTDGRFANNKGSYMFSARRGTLDLTFKAIGANETTPQFYDGMTKVEYILSDKHQISFNLLHAADKTAIRDIKPDNEDIHDTKYSNTYFWTVLKSQFNSKLFVRSLLYGGKISHVRNGYFHKNDFTDKGDFLLKDERSYGFVGAKQDWNFEAHKRFEIKFGFDVRQLNAKYNYEQEISEIRVNKFDSLYVFNRSIDVEAKPSGQLHNLYFSGRFMVVPKVFLEAGLRYDVATYANDKLLSPRISAVYAFSRNTFLRAAWGYYYQSQFMNNLDVNHNGTKFNPAELSKHYIVGFEHLFEKGISLRLEAYQKDISRISPIYQNLRDPWEVFPESRNDVVKLNIDGAKAKGVELFLKFDQSKKISWWLSYSIAKAVDNIVSIEYDGIYTEKLGNQLRPNNQFHTIYIDGNYRLNKKWHFSLSWQYYKGWPRTTYTYHFQTLPSGELHFYQKHESFNGERYPAYHRMDVRINKNFYLDKSKVSVFVHIINLYNKPNLKKFDLGIGTDENGNTISDGNGAYVITRDDTNWFGLTPVIGMTWEF
jgi:outer membrane receptor protein involved in Fe transport